ncbi:hypothetical protein HOLleu_41720 [Holothuria leucospilota]|uniref:Uncharacterized protein n=1 Tax=Holothuria leucospilota TaxID=206669 RepID=A0A9Q0YEC7_HOLLE|nr:hypothetical protein HOLleu_41720 [Holothuria leucospilota]
MNTKTVLLALALVLALVISTSEARNYYYAPGNRPNSGRQRNRGNKAFKNPFLKRFMEEYYGTDKAPYVNPNDVGVYGDDLDVE